MSGHSQIFSKCNNCQDPSAEVSRLYRFIKKYRGDFLEVKMFECQNCKDVWCIIGQSDWKPKEELQTKIEQ